jgi:hypothetical protein
MIQKIENLFCAIPSFREEMKKSRFKIWLRGFLLVLFSTIFGLYFLRDIAQGFFRWEWVALTIALFMPIGFLLSRIVPMKANLELRAVNLSLDRVYLILIWVLVIAKLILGQIPALVFMADIIMGSIIGIMFGRLGGIGLRVRQLKIQHGIRTR